MPQYDLYHETVKQALEKDGWTITADPFVIEYKGLRLYADLGAEKVIAALQIPWMILEPLSPEVTLAELEPLNEGAHGAVHDQDALLDRGLQACGGV